MEKPRNKDIFNPEYKRDEPFLTTTKAKKIFWIFILIVVVCYGATRFIVGNTVNIKITNVKGRIVNDIVFNVTIGNEIFVNYIVINKSPYSIRLIISHTEKELLFFTTNYNDEIIRKNHVYNIWFKFVNNSTEHYICIIGLDGIKS